MLTVFASIMSVIKLVPIVDKWVERFVVWYAENQIATMVKENREAMKKAIEAQDQRDLEKVIGNPNAGEPSGTPGTVIRDSLPGVKP